MSLRSLCEEHTTLSSGDIEILLGVESSLQLIANITASDAFIDCMGTGGDSALVVAQAQPECGRESLYKGSVVGMPVLRKNEPAVFHALESGCPVRDLKAVTQENASVKQDVVPIMGAGNSRVIGVLIRERDISESIMQEKKFHELARRQEDKNFHNGRETDKEDFHRAAIREMHHRVKNSLQLVASIMNLQAGQFDDPEVRKIFEENNARVLSIAATHDIISLSGSGENAEKISLFNLLSGVARNLEMIASLTRRVRIEIEGEDVEVDSDIASSIALVANELVSNSIRHGYGEGEEGLVSIAIHRGSLNTAVWVEDDGRGFDRGAMRENLGLRLVSLTVRERLNGDFFISSSDRGTRASFSFKNRI